MKKVTLRLRLIFVSGVGSGNHIQRRGVAEKVKQDEFLENGKHTFKERTIRYKVQIFVSSSLYVRVVCH